MLINYRLNIFMGKLCSRWSRAFKVRKVRPLCSIEVWSESTVPLIVNGQSLKNYMGEDAAKQVVCFILEAPS